MTLGKVVVRRLLQSWGPSLRAIAVVVMASVLAGCVWVMSRHVQGVGFPEEEPKPEEARVR